MSNNESIVKDSRNYAGVSAQQRAQERKDKLMSAALEIVGTQGFKNATVRTICKESGLTQRYYYEAFENAEDMLIQLYNHELKRLYSHIQTVINNEKKTEEKLRAGLRAYLETLYNDPRIARVILSEVLGVSEKVDLAYQTHTNRFVTFLTVLYKQLVFDSVKKNLNLPYEMFARGSVGAVVFIARNWVMTGYEEDLDKLVDDISFLPTKVIKHSGKLRFFL
ncbi:TetR/AcrR family transcriptional regulator [Veronia pacifica]|uniref:HTH tetR-type domain-containing protein n=1 Tax=Veronia pacifica TaxID=1080227 RepID=A0A1C3ERV2_9GAMM|nr:TetR/AcrR family transcriptional regulator [Veronia pacifica]ODA35918.1 hypothetical protein A8L45_02475 [Veronia pacifica]